MIGVYSITNPKGHIYIGSSLNIAKRWKSYMNLKTKSQPKIYASLLKYGPAKHKFKVLIECQIHELYEWEHHFSNYYQSLGSKGLNCSVPPYNQVKTIRPSRYKGPHTTIGSTMPPSLINKLIQIQKKLNENGESVTRSELFTEGLRMFINKNKSLLTKRN